MIISKKQTDRYQRQIIIPEIAIEGQKKLLESTVLVCGGSVKEIMTSVLYLSAMGVGNILCFLKDDTGFNELLRITNDLNDDVSITEVKNISSLQNINVRICLGSIDFIKSNIAEAEYYPTVISAVNQWKCFLGTFCDEDDLKEFIELLEFDKFSYAHNVFALSVAGVLCALESVKLILNIGSHENILVADLYDMDFRVFDGSHNADAIKNFYNCRENYVPHVHAQDKLKASKVLVVGAGGLGSPAALCLAMAGIGTIGLLDSDSVELSNLNRQILHSVSKIGMAKAESAKLFISDMNHDININTHIIELSEENAESLIKDYDIVVCAVDNIQTRYIINDMCYKLKKTVIEAGVLNFYGTNTTIVPDEGHCYRCLYPNVNTSTLPGKAGILGAVPGIMGFIEAAEAVKTILNKGITLKNKILMFDGLQMEFTVVNVEKNPDCPVCGTKNVSS